MTEAEWLACTSFVDILNLFPASTNARKLRLFAVSCCRRLASLAKRSGPVLDVAERFGEGLADRDTLRRAYQEAFGLVLSHENNPGDERAYEAANAVAWASVAEGVGVRECVAYAAYHAGRAAGLAERRVQALLLADIMLTSPSTAVPPTVLAWNDRISPASPKQFTKTARCPRGLSTPAASPSSPTPCLTPVATMRI